LAGFFYGITATRQYGGSAVRQYGNRATSYYPLLVTRHSLLVTSMYGWPLDTVRRLRADPYEL